LRPDLLHESLHLSGTGEAGFINHVKVSPVGISFIWSSPPRARKPCSVSAEMPACRSWAAARLVGAKPSTA
jgi:hypothetical protein